MSNIFVLFCFPDCPAEPTPVPADATVSPDFPTVKLLTDTTLLFASALLLMALVIFLISYVSHQTHGLLSLTHHTAPVLSKHLEFVHLIDLFFFFTTVLLEEHFQGQREDDKKRDPAERAAQTAWKEGLNVDLHSRLQSSDEAHLCLKIRRWSQERDRAVRPSQRLTLRRNPEAFRRAGIRGVTRVGVRPPGPHDEECLGKNQRGDCWGCAAAKEEKLTGEGRSYNAQLSAQTVIFLADLLQNLEKLATFSKFSFCQNQEFITLDYIFAFFKFSLWVWSKQMVLISQNCVPRVHILLDKWNTGY